MRDFRNLQKNGSLTAAELKEFVEQMRGRRPQEVLGLVAHSGLAQGIAAATVMVVFLVALGTVVPYALGKAFPEPVAAKPQPAEQPAETPEKPAEQPATSTEAAATPAAQPTPNELPDLLGEGEVRTSDAKTNPLEGKVDDLLNEIDKKKP
jgi:hypothetical protein